MSAKKFLEAKLLIHVSYGLHDRDGHYTKFVGTSMTSMFENTREEITVHILHDKTLTPANRDKLNYVVGKYNQRIKFHNVGKLMPDKLKFLAEKIPVITQGRFSIGTFYRLLMVNLLPELGVDRLIYLDADILVNLDIADLWFTRLGDHPLAAVPELEATFGHMVENKHIIESGRVKAEDYFNAGVLLLDLDAINRAVEDIFTSGINFLVDNPKCECFDQDILNNWFSTTYLKLDKRFDFFVQADRLFVGSKKLAPNIYHYAGQEINFDMTNIYSKLFFDHFMRTPWFSTELIGQMYEYLRRTNAQMKVTIQQLSALLARRKRAFFIEPQVMEPMKQFFGVMSVEEVIDASEKNAAGHLIRSMRESNGTKIYFLFVTNFSPLHDMLKAEGFAYGSDYVNGRTFLDEKQGGMQLNSYEFIKRM